MILRKLCLIVPMLLVIGSLLAYTTFKLKRNIDYKCGEFGNGGFFLEPDTTTQNVLAGILGKGFVFDVDGILISRGFLTSSSRWKMVDIVSVTKSKKICKIDVIYRAGHSDAQIVNCKCAEKLNVWLGEAGRSVRFPVYPSEKDN